MSQLRIPLIDGPTALLESRRFRRLLTDPTFDPLRAIMICPTSS